MSRFRLLSSAPLLLLLAAPSALATTVTQFNVSVIQNFDTLAASGTTNTTLPAGWSFLESGTSANTTYAAGTGSSSTGNTYSFGASGSAERAFGTLRTGSLGSSLGTAVLNQTGEIISDLTIAYMGEQWRLGALGRVDQLDFAYSANATSLGDGTWTDVNALDFVAPVTSGSTGALNGNLAENAVALSHTLTGLSLAPGATLWLRWSDFAATGSNDGLAIDDVVITATKTVVTIPDTPPGAAVPDSMPLAFAAVTLLGLLRGARQSRSGAVVGASSTVPEQR